MMDSVGRPAFTCDSTKLVTNASSVISSVAMAVRATYGLGDNGKREIDDELSTRALLVCEHARGTNTASTATPYIYVCGARACDMVTRLRVDNAEDGVDACGDGIVVLRHVLLMHVARSWSPKRWAMLLLLPMRTRMLMRAMLMLASVLAKPYTQ